MESAADPLPLARKGLSIKMNFHSVSEAKQLRLRHLALNGLGAMFVGLMVDALLYVGLYGILFYFVAFGSRARYRIESIEFLFTHYSIINYAFLVIMAVGILACLIEFGKEILIASPERMSFDSTHNHDDSHDSIPMMVLLAPYLKVMGVGMLLQALLLWRTSPGTVVRLACVLRVYGPMSRETLGAATEECGRKAARILFAFGAAEHTRSGELRLTESWERFLADSQQKSIYS